MLALEDILKKYERPKTTITSQRAEIIKQFFDELTRERKIDNWMRYLGVNRVRCSKGGIKLTPDEFKKHELFLKPFTASYIAFRLSHVKDLSDLYYFLSICKDSKNKTGSFSKTFFGALKTK